MSQEDIPRRGLLARLLGALVPASSAAAAEPTPEPVASPSEKDDSGGLAKGALSEARDPLAGWRS